MDGVHEFMDFYQSLGDAPVLLNRTGAIIATLQDIVIDENWFHARIVDDLLPDDINHLLDTYEDRVNQQLFSLLDEIEEQIRDLGLWFVLTDSRRMRVSHLQKSDDSIVIRGEWIVEQAEYTL